MPPTAAKYSITGDGDIYGGIVAMPEHADKAVLHSQVDEVSHPEWYEPIFSDYVTSKEVVLPGFTVFTPDEAAEAYSLLDSQGLRSRVKDPSERCERGQYCVKSMDEIVALVTRYRDRTALSGTNIQP